MSIEATLAHPGSATTSATLIVILFVTTAGLGIPDIFITKTFKFYLKKIPVYPFVEYILLFFVLQGNNARIV